MDKEKSYVLIDTDVLINFFDKNKKHNQVAIDAFYDFNKKYIKPCISIVSSIEMLQGNKSNAEKKKVLKQIEPFTAISLSDGICAIARELIIKYSASHGLLLGDAFNPATALHLNIPLFTFNKKDFRLINDLNLYEP